MARAPSDLAIKIEYALQCANMSKARLAFEAKVDKSLVGRWARGLVVPSENNLAIVTEIFARQFQGFNLTSWHLPMASFAASVGGTTRSDPPAGEVSGGPHGAFLGRAFAESSATMQHDGRHSLGVYLGFRQGLSMGSRLICDVYVIWQDGGTLLFRQWGLSFGHVGPACVLRSQVYLMGEDAGTVHGLFFSLLNGVLGGRAVRMDGLILCSAGTHRLNTPSATAVVWQRISDLPPGDGCPDLAVLERLIERVRIRAADDSLREWIAPEILAAVSREYDETFDFRLPILQMHAERSLSCNEVECGEAMVQYIRTLRDVFLAEDGELLPMDALEGAPRLAFSSAGAP